MHASDSLYPPSPRDVPPDLTAPGPGYQLRVSLVLVSLIVFFLLYLGLLIGSGWLITWSLVTTGDARGMRESGGVLDALPVAEDDSALS